ncbi:MAG: hypothetical protein HKN92_11855 [Chitinophagales bacterium]|nr:hypothetical protein [Chitinophagales bacterium]
MKNKLKYCALLLLLPMFSVAQEDLGSTDIIVEKEFEGIIEDARKIGVANPDLDNVDSISPSQYDLPKYWMDVPYEKSKLRPVAMPEEITLGGYNSYFKAGFGTQLSPLVEIMYNDRNVKNLVFGFKYDHFSASSSKTDFKRFSQNSAGTYMGYSMKKVKMNTAFSFDRLVHHLYGKEYPDSIDRLDVRNKIRDFQLTYDIANIKKNKSGIDFNSDIGFYYLKDERDIRDYNVNFNASISKEIFDDHFVDLQFSSKYNNFKDVFGNELSNTIVTIRPTYRFDFAGFNFLSEIGLTADEKLYYILPRIEIKRNLFDNYAIASIGWKKFHDQNTYREYLLENPYLTDLFISNNSRGSKLWLGLKGSVGKFSYNLEGSLQQVKRLALFENNPFQPEEFIVSYDGNTKIQNIHADGGLSISDDLQFIIGMDYNFYDPEKVPKAFHRSGFIGNFGAIYNLRDKILFRLDLVGMSSAYGSDAGEAVKLNGLVDANLEVSYQFSEYLSFFASMNNIASQKHERWMFYPTYGFNGLIGAKFKY